MVPGMLSEIEVYAEQTYLDQVFSLATTDLVQDKTLSHFQSLDDTVSEGFVSSGSKFQPRTEYAARRLANQPLQLAQLGQTAWIHHTQVGSCEALQDALAACALHAMRNAINATIVRSEIARRASRLVASVRAELNKTPNQHLGQRSDLLPCLQALLVYQCIRLFSDSDIGQRAQAERDEGILRFLASALTDSIPPMSSAEDQNWSQWVWEESFRRTILMAELVNGTHSFLKQGWDYADTRLLGMGFTAQVVLWEAKSSAQWQALWSCKSRIEVTIGTWDKDMVLAGPEDVEELGILTRVMHLGLEALEEWLGWQPNALIHWGLK